MRRAFGAQPAFLLPGAQGADLDRGPFAALGTNHSRRLIAGQQLYRPAREDNTSYACWTTIRSSVVLPKS